MVRAPNLFLQFGSFAISAHFVFESLAYAVGFAMYRWDRQRLGDALDQSNRNSVIVAAILGAAAGSKLLAALEEPMAFAHAPVALFLGGKTMVGALLGGTLAVEWIKRRLGITQRTGDLFAIPMCAAVAIGRIGCFFSGLADHTYGSATHLPWGMDFGDGIARHPAQLYEIVFLLLLGLMLSWLRRWLPPNGELFRIFLVSYLGWRLVIALPCATHTTIRAAYWPWRCRLSPDESCSFNLKQSLICASNQLRECCDADSMSWPGCRYKIHTCAELLSRGGTCNWRRRTGC